MLHVPLSTFLPTHTLMHSPPRSHPPPRQQASLELPFPGTPHRWAGADLSHHDFFPASGKQTHTLRFWLLLPNLNRMRPTHVAACSSLLFFCFAVRYCIL